MHLGGITPSAANLNILVICWRMFLYSLLSIVLVGKGFYFFVFNNIKNSTVDLWFFELMNNEK